MTFMLFLMTFLVILTFFRPYKCERNRTVIKLLTPRRKQKRPYFGRRQIRSKDDLKPGLDCITVTPHNRYYIRITSRPYNAEGFAAQRCSYRVGDREDSFSLADCNLVPYKDSEQERWNQTNHLRRLAWLPLFDYLFIHTKLCKLVMRIGLVMSLLSIALLFLSILFPLAVPLVVLGSVALFLGVGCLIVVKLSQ